MPAARVRLCFVCLGNICRSPTAEGVMKRVVADEGLADVIDVDSAGTAAYHAGERADKRARQHAERRGLSLDSHARQFVDADYDAFDYVLAMDESNLEDLRSLPGAASFEGELALLRRFDPIAPSGAEVPDPYYGGNRGFEDVLDLCEAACRGLLAHVRQHFDVE